MPPDQHDPSPRAGDAPAPGTAELEHNGDGVAVVSLHGEHDISTEPALTRALDAAIARSRVLVDLSECTFIDSTVIAALVGCARAVHARGEQFALVIPPEQRNVARVAEMIRLGELLSLHATRDAALASLARPS